ncbi:MAG TPA: hypothetical protein VHE81_13225 [Lacipirellulaceae bacterium]|nr:hypothetical protein [Lacipirellulaceae bacterium]
MNNLARKNLLDALVWALAVCAAVSLVPPARAQFAVIRGQNRFMMSDQQFNQWVFRSNGQGVDEDSEVTLMIDGVDRACHLTGEQKEKLRLAALGDFSRFKQEVDELRDEYVGKPYDQNDINKIWQKIQPFASRYQAGLLGDSSLFSKVVHQILTPAQQAEYEAAEAHRRQAAHAAKVRLFVALLERNCPLTSHQRNALVNLLIKETKPAKRHSEYDWYVVVVQTAKIPDEELKPILDPAQMRFFNKVSQQGRGMEMWLKRMDVLPDP